MFSRPMVLMFSVFLLLMTVVSSSDYGDNSQADKEKMMRQAQLLFFNRPRYLRGGGWNWQKDNRDEKMSQEVEDRQDNAPPETRLIRASRLQHLHSLDSLFNQDFKPRFGKRMYQPNAGYGVYPTIDRDQLENWLTFSRRR